jgi:uncharacterized OB-fold protein
MVEVGVGSIYRPSRVLDGHRRAGADEDGFTMGAAALELLAGGLGATPPRTIELVGDFPPTAEWGYGVLLGGPAAVTRHAASWDGVRAALSAAHSRSLVLASVSAAAASAGAVALALGGPGGPSPEGPSGPGSWFDALVRWAEGATSLRSEDSALQTVATTPEEVEAADAFRGAPTTVVSEGAYVPEPRYRENLPSRWNLRAERCASCGRVTFPARGVCAYCSRRDALVVGHLPRDIARVVARTTIGKGGQPTEFDAQVATTGPYDVVLAAWPVGVRVTLPVAEAAPGALRIGDRIRTRLRRLYPMEGDWRYGRKALPHPGVS